jgi:hypothetical protein
MNFGNTNPNPYPYGTLNGAGGGNSLNTLGGSVRYTTPDLNLGKGTSLNGYVQRDGHLGSFNPNTGSNSFGIGFTKRF